MDVRIGQRRRGPALRLVRAVVKGDETRAGNHVVRTSATKILQSRNQLILEIQTTEPSFSLQGFSVLLLGCHVQQQCSPHRLLTDTHHVLDPGGSDGKDLPAMLETWVRFLGWEDPLEEGTTTHSIILAWRILWTEEPGGLLSIGLHRVGHD